MAWRSRELAGSLDAVAAGVLLALAQRPRRMLIVGLDDPMRVGRDR
jgi:hypothetical protein